MSKIHWSTAVSDDFNNAADWSTKTVPGAGDDAILDAAGSTAYTVTATTNETVSSIQLNSTATLVISSGTTFTATTGTGSGFNAGVIQVGDAATFAIGGTIDNEGAGTIALNSLGDVTTLAIMKNTTLASLGQVTLDDSSGNLIAGGASSTTLTNAGNVISGAGTIGSATLTLVNQGAASIIQATGTNALIIDTGAHTVTNSGSIESTGTGGLSLRSATNNSGSIEGVGAGALVIAATVTNTGLIVAFGGGLLGLQGGTINGGTVGIDAGGALTVGGGSNLIAAATFTNAGSITINDADALGLAGSITNSGTIALSSLGDATTLAIAKNTTLSGKGSVVLDDSTANFVVGGASATTLTNVDDTLSGAGVIGSATLTVANQAGGVINATGSNGLIVDTGTHTVVNAGLVEATGAGGLSLRSATTNAGTLKGAGLGALAIVGAAVTNTGGLVSAVKGGHVSLQGASVSGGTVSIASGGLLSADSGASLVAADTFTNAGTVAVNDAATLGVAGSIANSGTIALDSLGDGTTLSIAQAVSLTGKGALVLGDSSANFVVGGASATILTNVNDTISGAGTIGSASLTLVNQANGVIDATGANALVLDTGANTIVNGGLIEAMGGGGLILRSTVANAGGSLLGGAASSVSLQGVTVIGGTLKGAGTFSVAGGATFDGRASSLANQALVQVNDAQTLGLEGSIANSGTIALNSLGDATTLAIAQNTTLSGKGSVVLDDSTANSIVGGAAATTLTNVDNTITGAGTIGSATLTLVNQAAGAIEATGANALVLDTASSTIINAGLIEAAAGTGGLTIQSAISNAGTLLAHKGVLTVTGPLTNLSGSTLTGGTYQADSGATLELTQNAQVATDKATLVLNGGGSAIQALNTTSGKEVGIEATLAAIAASGALEVLGGRNWSSKQALSNAGTLRLGGGTFTSGTLTGQAGSTLTGFGTVASVFKDSGTVTASGGAFIFTGKGDTFAGALGGTEIDFVGGTQALNAGISLTVATLALSGGAVATLGADLTYGGDIGEDASATIDVSAHTLTLAGTGSTLAGTVTGSGTLAFAGGTQRIDGGAAINVAAWSLSGSTVTTVDESLIYAGSFSQAAGTVLHIAAGDTVGLTGASSLSGGIDGGAVQVSAATVNGLTIGGSTTLVDIGFVHEVGDLTLGDSSKKAATLTISAGAIYSIDNDSGIALGHSKKSSIKDSGLLIKSAGTGVSVIAPKVTDGGTIEAASGTFDFKGALSGGGSMKVDGGATLEVDSSATASLGMTFNGGGGVLALGKAASFAATIHGFAPTDTIDLLKTAATAATLGAGDTLVITNGATTVATLRLAGKYAGDTFTVISDGHGGSDITVSTSPGAHAVAPAPPTANLATHRFASAMAALSGGGGVCAPPSPAHGEGPHAMLAAVRQARLA